jgi:hypothetical protein
VTGRWGPNTLNAVVQTLCRFARAVLGLMVFFAELRRAEDCDVCFARVDRSKTANCTTAANKGHHVGNLEDPN